VAPHPSRQPTDPIPLSSSPAPNSKIIFRLPFQFNSFVEPQKLNGSLEHSTGKLDFTVLFPCSASIIQEDISPNYFFNILQKEAQETRTLDAVNTSIQNATDLLTVYLRLKEVQKEDTKVTLYGRTPTGTHLGVLIKKNEGREDIAIAIKSDSATLLDNILKEVQTLEW